jgi:hypothetical protein
MAFDILRKIFNIANMVVPDICVCVCVSVCVCVC